MLTSSCAMSNPGRGQWRERACRVSSDTNIRSDRPNAACGRRTPQSAVCSKLCSDRVGKPQIGTRWDRIGIWTFSGRNREFRCDSRKADRPQTGLANHRLQPLGHLTAARNLSIRQASSYGNATLPQIVPTSIQKQPLDSTLRARRSAVPNAAVRFADKHAGN